MIPPFNLDIFRFKKYSLNHFTPFYNILNFHPCLPLSAAEAKPCNEKIHVVICAQPTVAEHPLDVALGKKHANN